MTLERRNGTGWDLCLYGFLAWRYFLVHQLRIARTQGESYSEIGLRNRAVFRASRLKSEGGHHRKKWTPEGGTPKYICKFCQVLGWSIRMERTGQRWQRRICFRYWSLDLAPWIHIWIYVLRLNDFLCDTKLCCPECDPEQMWETWEYSAALAQLGDPALLGRPRCLQLCRHGTKLQFFSHPRGLLQ